MTHVAVILIMCLLAGVLLLDKYSIGEFGISQPLISASILGFTAGDFSSGVLLGVLLQPMWLVELPIGRKVPLDAQAAGISGTIAFFTLRMIGGFSIEVSALLAIVIAAGISVLGGWFDLLQRKINGYIALRLERVKNLKEIVFIHAATLDIAFLRGVLLGLLTVVFSLIVIPIGSIIPGISLPRLLAATFSIGLAGGVYLLGIKKQLIPTVVGFTSWICIWLYLRFL